MCVIGTAASKFLGKGNSGVRLKYGLIRYVRYLWFVSEENGKLSCLFETTSY